MKAYRSVSIACITLSLFIINLYAQAPELINYQGRLIQGANLVCCAWRARLFPSLTLPALLPSMPA